MTEQLWEKVAEHLSDSNGAAEFGRHAAQAGVHSDSESGYGLYSDCGNNKSMA